MTVSRMPDAVGREHEAAESMATGTSAWWRRAVIYQIYPRSFNDSDGDGIGDLRGIIQRLDYLSETLGVDALWCCPFYPSPQVDFGYDVSDFTDVDPVFGTLADFDQLITEAHRRGLRVVIDFIPNHSADTHPWFQEARRSRTSPKRDWYVWADPAPDGSPPSNWTSEQGGSTWTLDPRSGQYYLHSFHSSMPDLNWRSPGLRAAMLGVLRFWLDRGVDGFRIDVAHLIAKDPELRDNPTRHDATPNPTDRQHPDYDRQHHVHDRLHPDLHGYLREIREVLDGYGGDRVAIGEIEVMPWDRWSRFFGSRDDELHLPFNFHTIEAGWTAEALRDSIEGQEAALPRGGWPNYVLSNHDRPRAASRNGRSSVRLALMLLLTLRGTPTLYYGEELGLPDIELPASAWRDPLGRDQARAPMPWTRDGGFTDATEPWLPRTTERNVEDQLADPASELNLCRALLARRRRHAALHGGAYRGLTDTPADCLGYLRISDSETLAILLNLGSSIIRVPLPASATCLLSTTGSTRLESTDGSVALDPFEGRLFRLDL